MGIALNRKNFYTQKTGRKQRIVDMLPSKSFSHVFLDATFFDQGFIFHAFSFSCTDFQAVIAAVIFTNSQSYPHSLFQEDSAIKKVNSSKTEKAKVKTMGNVYAYVRVSTLHQNEDRQMIAMSKIQVPEKNIYVEKQSGKDFNRPVYRKLLKKLKQDDVLYIKSIDRLGRNYDEVLEQWRILTKQKGVDIVVLDMPLLDTRRDKDLLGTLIADLVLSLLSYVSENERCAIRQRQREGIEAAKKKGVKFGRPPKLLPEDFEQIYIHWQKREINGDEAAKLCEFSKTTFYRKVKELTTENPS